MTEFNPQSIEGKIYFSPILDLYNGEVVSFNLDTYPTVKFTTDALDKALAKVTSPEKTNYPY